MLFRSCNYNCFYCHNRELISPEGPQKAPQVHPDQVLSHLSRRRTLLEGVVISGGEPTLQKDLELFIREVRQLGLLVKLDTNGSSPDVLDRLIAGGMIDYAALDVKAPWDRYREICGKQADCSAVQDCLRILKDSHIDWEVRTTVCPTLHGYDLEEIAQQLAEVPLWRWNLYRRPEQYRLEDAPRVCAPALSSVKLQRIEQQLGRTVHPAVVMP